MREGEQYSTYTEANILYVYARTSHAWRPMYKHASVSQGFSAINQTLFTLKL